MNILWIFVVLQTVLAQPSFGRSYLRNSRLCHQWSCINTKLGLSDSLPTSQEFDIVLRGLLPPEWHGVVDEVLNTCFHDRPRRYSNTCPGQAIMHCAVDQLIAKCPEAYQRKEDACAPVNTLAGFNNMFTQSRYENIERNIAVERRPAWFLTNYFNTKCCNLPALFNSTTLSECGFTSFIKYYIHNPTIQSPGVLPSQRRFATTPTTPANNGDTLHVVSLNDIQPEASQKPSDPLNCCDISDFIQPSWRQECNFELDWAGQSRLVIKNEASETASTTAEPTSTSSTVTRTDVSIVPQTCEQETCVFNKLNILSSSGVVDIDAFIKLLDNFTTAQPTWNSAKGRVVTTCLRKPVTKYSGQCEINKILACTFDVLTENCPYASKSDLCKHTNSQRTCQISSSKCRPKHRREICTLPDLVNREILTECGITSLGKVEPVITVTKPKTYRLFTSRFKCQDLTPSTTCLLSKMGVLNKYGFMDYFKMKDRIRHFTSNNEWSNLNTVVMNAFNYGPLYKEHCNSAKKLLNVLDSVLLTCPDSRKKDTAQCATSFNEIKNTPAIYTNVSQEYNNQILNHFLHVYNPSVKTPKVFRRKHFKKIKKTPIYNYGILNDKNAPKVVTIDVKPKVEKQPLVEKPPLVLLPVYMRVPHSNLLIRPFNENGVLRSSLSSNNQIAQAHTSTASPIFTSAVSTSMPISTTQPISKLPSTVPHSNLLLRPFNENGVMRNSFALHNKIAQAHVSTASPNFTSSGSTSKPISTTPPISTRYRISTEFNSKFEMLKPE